ncbi:Uncharacterised protein [Vibrio cholerae]|nr:Uncharacterised protein [Vibrio cholerae]CSI75755.1 Uncharacterised protein [Vibrio cholerae]
MGSPKTSLRLCKSVLASPFTRWLPTGHFKLYRHMASQPRHIHDIGWECISIFL